MTIKREQKAKADVYQAEIDGKSLATLYRAKSNDRPTCIHIHDAHFNLCAFDKVIELANALFELVLIARKPMTEEAAHYKVERPLHEMSVEKLHHFRCYHCQQWWTIADWQSTEFIYCPHCGTKARVQEITT